MSPVSPHLPEHPDRLRRHPEPKVSYDVVIGGGHGLAAAATARTSILVRYTAEGRRRTRDRA